MDALVSAQVAAPPIDDQEKEIASCCLQRTSEAEPEKQDEDTEDSKIQMMKMILRYLQGLL